MRIERVLLEDLAGVGFAPDARVSVPLDGFTVIVGRNGVGKSRLLDYTAALLTADPTGLDRGRPTDGRAAAPFGHLHLVAERLEQPDGDWPIVRDLLRSMPDDLGEFSDVGDVRDYVDGWLPDRRLGLVEQDWSEFDDEDDYLEAIECTREESRSFGMFRYRLMRNAGSGRFGALVNLLLGDGDELHFGLQRLDGGLLWLMCRPDEALPFVEALASSSTEIADLWRVLAEPGDEWRPFVCLGDVGDASESARCVLPLPDVTWIRDRMVDPGLVVAEVIPVRLASGEGRMRRTDAGLHYAEWFLAELADLEQRANRHAPEFVTTFGRIVLEPDDDDVYDVRVRFERAGGSGSVDWADLGAGSRRWVAAAIEAAARPRPTVGPADPYGGRPILVVDEPELHLHPTAQRDVRRWLEERCRDGAAVLVASHSAQFLNVGVANSHLLGLVAGPTGTEAVGVDGGLLLAGGRNSFLDRLGFDAAASVAATRGVLVVEGQHDLLFLRRFFGDRIDEARVRILPIRGTKNARALAAAELWPTLGVPVCLLFDDVRAAALDGPIPEDATPEEKKLRESLDTFRRMQHRHMEVVAAHFELPDVIAAIPEDVIKRAFPRARTTVTWSEIIDDWRRTVAPGEFKQYALRRLEVGSDANAFVDRVLAQANDGEVAAALTRSVSEALAKLAAVADEGGSPAEAFGSGT